MQKMFKIKMVNKNYQKGTRFERKLVNEARAKKCIAFRSAGSHSPIDVVVIDTKNKRIWFHQCKKGKHNLTKKMKKDFENLSDEYIAIFNIEEEPADKRKLKNTNKKEVN